DRPVRERLDLARVVLVRRRALEQHVLDVPRDQLAHEVRLDALAPAHEADAVPALLDLDRLLLVADQEALLGRLGRAGDRRVGRHAHDPRLVVALGHRSVASSPWSWTSTASSPIAAASTVRPIGTRSARTTSRRSSTSTATCTGSVR